MQSSGMDFSKLLHCEHRCKNLNVVFSPMAVLSECSFYTLMVYRPYLLCGKPPVPDTYGKGLGVCLGFFSMPLQVIPQAQL